MKLYKNKEKIGSLKHDKGCFENGENLFAIELLLHFA